MKLLIVAVVVIALLVVVAVVFGPGLLSRVGVSLPRGEPGPVALSLPAGFRGDVFASDLDGPRFIAYSPDGVLVVAERGANRVVALPDRDADGAADEEVVVVEGLDSPSSVAFYEGWLYVGETSRVIRLRLGPDLQGGDQEVVVPGLPEGGQHTTRTVLLGPDGRLFVSVGSTCNVCEEEDPRRAAISVYGAAGGDGRIFARGLRNAVGLAINPWTGELWATNNGRDWMGDNQPPETVYVVRDGADYGWPRCHAGDVSDPEYGGRGACDGVEPPAVEMQAHMAPLGLAFYDGEQFPEAYRRDLYVALHGSWNRTVPVGYKVVRIPLEDGTAPTGEVLDFATGWLQDSREVAPGRPVDIAVAPDGSLMVSDDRAGLIYRIRYTGE
jgi:glucose/arabinose dehydrogenase